MNRKIFNRRIHQLEKKLKLAKNVSEKSWIQTRSLMKIKLPDILNLQCKRAKKLHRTFKQKKKLEKKKLEKKSKYPRILKDYQTRCECGSIITNNPTNIAAHGYSIKHTLYVIDKKYNPM